MPPPSPPTVTHRRVRRTPRRSRGRQRPPKRVATSTTVMAIRSRMLPIRYALVVTAVWLIATATYFAFRDDAPSRLIGAQTEPQIFYEDRSADLRAQVDGITSLTSAEE